MSKWIAYVKDFAKKNNLTYPEALKEPKCSIGYRKIKGGMVNEDNSSIKALTGKEGTKTKSVITQKDFADDRIPTNIIKIGTNLNPAQKEEYLNEDRALRLSRGKPIATGYVVLGQFERWEADRQVRKAALILKNAERTVAEREAREQKEKKP
jgi:hypothetical protein